MGLLLSQNCLAQMKESVYKALMAYETPKRIKSRLEQKAYRLAGNKRNAMLLSSAFSVVSKRQLKFNIRFKGHTTHWAVTNNSISANITWEF